MHQFDEYPERVRPVMANLRALILEAASEIESDHRRKKLPLLGM